MFYYEILIFYSRKDSRSIFVESNRDNLDVDDIDDSLEYLISDNKISKEDAEHVTDIYSILKQKRVPPLPQVVGEFSKLTLLFFVFYGIFFYFMLY